MFEHGLKDIIYFLFEWCDLYADFSQAQMNDASEVLAVIFDCLHRSFTRGSSISDTESVGSNSIRSWDCENSSCIAHSLFGMDIFERMNCQLCGLESRYLKYTSFFHNINASSLRTVKVSLDVKLFYELPPLFFPACGNMSRQLCLLST